MVGTIGSCMSSMATRHPCITTAPGPDGRLHLENTDESVIGYLATLSHRHPSFPL